MARAKHGPRERRRHRAVLRQTKGFQQGRRRLYRRAHEALLKARQHEYRDRRRRKRDMRRLWIQRINAAARQHGMSYGGFMHRLRHAGVELDRKTLAHLAATDSVAFGHLAQLAGAVQDR